MKIVMTGAEGRLGKELVKLLNNHTLVTPTHKEMDITQYGDVGTILLKEKPDLVIHCAAYTDVKLAEKERKLCWYTNVVGTRIVARFTPHRLLHISTDYVFSGEEGGYREIDVPAPTTYYGFTKAVAEEAAWKAPRPIIARLSFKPREWPHPFALIDLYTSADFTDVIAKQLSLLVENFDKFPEPVVHLGTERKTVYDLVRKIKPDVKPGLITDLGKEGLYLPRDCSLNTSKFQYYQEQWTNSTPLSFPQKT